VNAQQNGDEIVRLSQQKWEWMSARNGTELAALFHDDAVFVHMGATFTKEQELEVITAGTIHYRDINIRDVSVRFIGPTAILLTTLQLGAVVGGNVVSNPFVVTEVYAREAGSWTLASMSFTRLSKPLTDT
jgi:ketosteroid isomerase-like protein